MDLITEQPFYFIILCFLLGIVYSFILYYKSKINDDLPRYLVYILFGLRFVAVFFISFFLLSPLLKQLITEEEKPILIVALDNSSSIKANMDSISLFNYHANMDKLITKFEEDFEVNQLIFDGDVQSNTPVNYKGKYTNINNFLEYVENNYSNRNVGAVIIGSDGLINQGANPVYTIERFNEPVYSVLLGDTVVKRDAGIKDVLHNEISFLGNKFPVQVEYSVSKGKNEKLVIAIYQNEEKLASQEVSVPNDDYLGILNFYIESKEPGIQKFTVRISSLDQEQNKKNNQLDFYVDVIENRERILIMANAPHPDIAAIRSAIAKKENYSVDVAFVEDFKESLEKYNLVVWVELPTSESPQMVKLLKQSKEQKIPGLFVCTQNTKFAVLNKYFSPLLSLSNKSNSISDAQAKFNDNFNLFVLNQTTIQQINELPPLMFPVTRNYMLNGEAQTLFNQQIGQIETDDPLVVLGANQEIKQGIILGEGLWRWRLANYRLNSNHDAFDEVIQKIIQYLSVKEDKSKFKIAVNNVFFENDEVVFRARLYNESYQQVNDSDINLDLTNEDGKEFNYQFIKLGEGYHLNAGILDVGKYTYEATATRNGVQYSKQGVLTVKPVMVEQLKTVANQTLMKQLAIQSGGNYYQWDNVTDLPKEIANREDVRPVLFSYEKLRELIHVDWLFYIILGLLSLEWFIRKRNGAY